MSDSLWPHESQHARPPCPSPTPGVHADLHPLSQWCHPAISSSVFPFFSCSQSLPASSIFSILLRNFYYFYNNKTKPLKNLVSIIHLKANNWAPFSAWFSGGNSLYQHRRHLLPGAGEVDGSVHPKWHNDTKLLPPGACLIALISPLGTRHKIPGKRCPGDEDKSSERDGQKDSLRKGCGKQKPLERKRDGGIGMGEMWRNRKERQLVFWGRIWRKPRLVLCPIRLVMNREAWHAAVHGVAKSQTRLSGVLPLFTNLLQSMKIELHFRLLFWIHRWISNNRLECCSRCHFLKSWYSCLRKGRKRHKSINQWTGAKDAFTYKGSFKGLVSKFSPYK